MMTTHSLNNLDFVQDVMQLFDSGVSIRRIASMMEVDIPLIDEIICSAISNDMTEDNTEDTV
jgi:hypothetical protein